MPLSSWSRTPTASDDESDPNSWTHLEEPHLEEASQRGGRLLVAQRGEGQEVAQRGGAQEVAQRGGTQEEAASSRVPESSSSEVMQAKQRLVSRAKRRPSSAPRRSSASDSSSIVAYEAGPYTFSTCSPSTLAYRHEQKYSVTYSAVAGSTTTGTDTGTELRITTTANTCTVLTPTTATCNGVTINRISNCENPENAGLNQAVCRVSRGVRRLKFSCQTGLGGTEGNSGNSVALANWKRFWRR